MSIFRITRQSELKRAEKGTLQSIKVVASCRTNAIFIAERWMARNNKVWSSDKPYIVEEIESMVIDFKLN